MISQLASTINGGNISTNAEKKHIRDSNNSMATLETVLVDAFASSDDEASNNEDSTSSLSLPIEEDETDRDLHGLAMIPSEEFTLPATTPDNVTRPHHRRTASSAGRLEGSKLKPILVGSPSKPRERKPFNVTFKGIPEESATTVESGEPRPTIPRQYSCVQLGSDRPPLMPKLDSPPRHRRQRSAPLPVPMSHTPSDQPGGNNSILETLQHNVVLLHYQYGNDPMVAATYNQIGNVHFRAKNYGPAEEAYLHAIDCCSFMSSSSGTSRDRLLAAAHANLGTIYWSTGRVDKAIASLRASLHLHEAVSHRATASSLSPLEDASLASTSSVLEIASVQYQLGLAYSLKSQYEKALRYLKKSLRVRKRVYGLGHVHVAQVIDALGKVHYLQGDLNAALTYHEQALCIKETCYSDKSVSEDSLVTTLRSIATVQLAMKDSEAAIASYTRVLALQKKALRLQQLSLVPGNAQQMELDIGNTLGTLGDLYKEQNDLDKAKSMYLAADFFLKDAAVSA